MPVGETATVFNRAPVGLHYVFDGCDFELEVGENKRVPAAHVPKIKNQHPIMGTENPHSMRGKFLVGVKGTKDVTEPLTEAEWDAHLSAIERWDRQYGSPIFGDLPKPPKVITRPKITGVDVSKGPKPLESGSRQFGLET